MNAKSWIKRVLIALLIAAAVLGGVWGFGMLGRTGMPREDGQRPIILGFSQLGSESGWRIGNTRSVVKAAADAVTGHFADLGTVYELARWFPVPTDAR